MKALVFDTSTLISLVTNNLLWVLRDLKKKFKGEFLVPFMVKKELIDVPMQSKKYEFEAIILQHFIHENYLTLYKNEEIAKKAKELYYLSNHLFSINDNYITLIHPGEVEALALAIYLKADAYVVDERTMRLLIENPEKAGALIENKTHTKIFVNKENLSRFKQEVKDVKIIRSTELMLAAYELGLLEHYIKDKIVHNELRRIMLDGVLWGLKLRGCSISGKEINEILTLEGL